MAATDAVKTQTVDNLTRMAFSGSLEKLEAGAVPSKLLRGVGRNIFLEMDERLTC